MLSCLSRNILPPNNSYRILLRKISKSLTTEEVNDLCYISQEAQSAGVQNKINFNGTVLFKFFEQRMLITDGNLDYLRESLQSIERIDLCKLIDDYMNNHLSGKSSTHSEPFIQLHSSEPHLQSSKPQSHAGSCPHSSHVVPHLQSSCPESHPQSLYSEPYRQPLFAEPQQQSSYYMEPCTNPQSYEKSLPQSYVPPPFNPEFSDPSQSPMAPHYPAQPTSSMNTIQPELQKISKPTPIEDDEQYDSQTMLYSVAGYQKSSGFMQTDYFRVKVDNSKMMLSPHNNEHYPQHDINGLKVELTNKDNKIKDLTKQINELKQLLQQKQQRESDSEQIIEHLQAQVEETLAQGETKAEAEKYEMKSKPHGIAVIFNNFEFYSIDSAVERLPTRTGSEIDEENLRIMWKYLNYDVRVYRNLTAAEMSRQLLLIAAEDHQNFDSFVCCILSHGHGDGVYGTDGKLVKITQLVGLFNGTNHYCPSLVGKPKLFFIQACRGDDEDKGVPLEESDGGLHSSLPGLADFLLAYCTPPGHASWRSPRYGSWYISKLREVFMKNAHHHDLLSMLTMVNKELSKVHTTDGYKQCSAPETLLRKQVWFLGNT